MLKSILIALVLLTLVLWGISYFIARNIEAAIPALGEKTKVNGSAVHFVDTGPVANTENPAVVFIHGASGNLRDPMPPYHDRLREEFRLIFVDRPGHGYSEAFDGSNDPKAQAAAIDGLLATLGVEKAIIVGHSFGGVVTGALGVLFPNRTAGLIFLAPVSHPWGTGVDWHYDVGNTPFIGWLFSRTIVPIAGSRMYPKAIKGVFAPNSMPDDYPEVSGTRLALRPANFHENAKDVARVVDHVEAFHERYKEIKVPTKIFHGDKDDIVSLEIHSINGLSKDIEDAELIVLQGVGHKPDYVASDAVIAAIREIAQQ